MIISPKPPRPPWLAAGDAPEPASSAREVAPAENSETPALLLLRAHLRHGAAARREAAAFALALTQPEVARAIAAFFAARGRGGMKNGR